MGDEQEPAERNPQTDTTQITQVMKPGPTQAVKPAPMQTGDGVQPAPKLPPVPVQSVPRPRAVPDDEDRTDDDPQGTSDGDELPAERRA